MRGIKSIGYALLAGCAFVLAGCGSIPVGAVNGEPVSGYICEPGSSFNGADPKTILRASCPKIGADDYAQRDVIVFVHGLGGDSITTWYNNKANVYWPSLIVEDPNFKGFDVYSFGYPTGIFGSQPYMYDVVKGMQARLAADGVTKHRRVYFVVHSLGGIITRNYLVEFPDLEEKTALIHYFGTPGAGSGLSLMLPFIGSVQTVGLKPVNDDSSLSVYRRMWEALGRRFKTARPATACACETRSYLSKPFQNLLVVERKSCEVMCPESQAFDVAERDHFSLVKPESRESNVYSTFSKTHRDFRKSADDTIKVRAGHDAGAALVNNGGATAASCPKSTETFTIDLARPYEVALMLYPGDSMVINGGGSGGLLPVQSDLSSHGMRALTTTQAMPDNCAILDSATSVGDVRYVHDAPGPAVIRFAKRAAGELGGWAYVDKGVVVGTVFKSPANDIARTVELFKVIDNGIRAPDPVPRPASLLPVCGDIKSALAGSWECAGYTSDVGFVRTSQNISFNPGQISHLAFAEAEQLRSVIATGEVKALVIRGFASPEPLSCRAWKTLINAGEPIDAESRVRFSAWPCYDGRPDANGNVLLSMARAEQFKKKLNGVFPGLRLVALGCGDRYADRSTYSTHWRGVVVEARRSDASSVSDNLLGCRIAD